MKRLILFFLLVVTWHGVFSQRVYFVYLQTEQEQPFFVKMNDKIYSSSASGYLILPKLYDSVYSIGVGFPQEKWPIQNFSVTVNKKDHGYLLKSFGDKGWGLFDLQTMAVQMATLPETKASTSIKSEKKEVSEFTDILSKASDDSTLKERQVLIKEEKKPDTIIQAVVKKEETKPIENVEPKKDEPKVQEIQQPVVKSEEKKPVSEAVYRKSIVTRKSESSTSNGVGLVFVDDHQNGTKDTVRILIPNPKSISSIVKEEPKEEKKLLGAINDSIKKKSDQEINKDVKPLIENPGLVKNSCKAVASESDFLTLRKNMAAKASNDAMVDEAKKYFKTKCFTTEQIKNLSVLFLNEEGKYKFFDAAYTNTSDVENFGSLQSELKEEYYVKRFKAMLR